MKKARFLGAVLAVTGLLAIASPALAVTFTLDELVSGSVSSFQSGNGLLTFSNFEIKKLKKLSGNLSLYTVTVLDDGFALSSSAFEATSGGLKKLRFSYEVTANTGTISGAALAMEATRDTGRVVVHKDLEDPASDEGTFLFTLLRKNASILDDSDTFGPGVTTLEVEELIRIKKISSLQSVSNTYTVVPEPTELTFLATGLGGLLWIGRRKRSLAAR